MAYKYGSDKCPQIKHPFTPVYFGLLKDKRKSTKKVLEIGIGGGASLLMWRDFFPNAQIYGADILPLALYNDERIKSFICDQTNKEDLQRLVDNIGPDVDLIVDDGSHKTEDQIFTCLTLMPIVNKKVIYIIEDVKAPETVITALSMYNCWIPNLKRKFKDDNLVVVRNS